MSLGRFVLGFFCVGAGISLGRYIAEAMAEVKSESTLYLTDGAKYTLTDTGEELLLANEEDELVAKAKSNPHYSTFGVEITEFVVDASKLSSEAGLIALFNKRF